MNIGKIISDLRDQKSWSQSDLAAKSGVSRVMIGKYEREEAIPSIEVARKIANTFEVTLDFLSGEGTNASFDKKIVKRIQDIEGLPENDKMHLLAIIDAFLRDAATRRAYGQ